MEIGQNNFQEQTTDKKWSFYRSWPFWVFIVLAIGLSVSWFILYYSPDLNIPEEEAHWYEIQGIVVEFDQDDNWMRIYWLNEITPDGEEGLMMIDEGEMTAKWEDDWDIQPHHPRLITGGEEVKIIPTQVWDEFDTEVYIDSLEILSGLRDQ